MKRLIAITLLLCLALACVPARAAGINCGPFTIDLSSGEKYTPAEEDAMRLYGVMAFLYFNGGQNYFHYNEETHTSYYDLDKNGSYDIEWLGSTPDVQWFMALPTNSVAGYISFNVHPNFFNGGPFDSFDYYSPLTFLFELPETFSDDTGSYAIDQNGEAEYQKPAKDAVNAKVPDTITVGGKAVPVTKIADNAFKGQKKLTKVTIGKNIKEIGKNAFANCAKLKTVSGGANVEIIGDSAFSGCKALAKFTIGAKVSKIGKKAFYKCAALKKITIKSKLLTKATVGSSAFKGIYKTATIKVPKAVKKDYTKWLLKKGVKKTMKIK